MRKFLWIITIQIMHEQRWSWPHYLGFGLYHDPITWFLALFAFSTSSPRSCSLSSRALRSAVNFSLSDCALDTSTLAWISSVLAESRSDSSRFTCFSVFSFSNYKVIESYFKITQYSFNKFLNKRSVIDVQWKWVKKI